MSDDDRDIDIESDDENDSDTKLQGRSSNSTQYFSQAEKRAHHNALERKRRDHIKDSFTSLRDSVPSLQGEKVHASRAQILKKAAEYITFMRRKNQSHQQDIDDLKRQNNNLETQIRQLERQRTSGEAMQIDGLVKEEDPSSESEITDIEDDHHLPTGSVASRKPGSAGGGPNRKIKTAAYNSKTIYQ